MRRWRSFIGREPKVTATLTSRLLVLEEPVQGNLTSTTYFYLALSSSFFFTFLGAARYGSVKVHVNVNVNVSH